jgi:hypothetical protein
MGDIQPVGIGMDIGVIEAAFPAIRWKDYMSNAAE